MPNAATRNEVRLIAVRLTDRFLDKGFSLREAELLALRQAVRTVRG